jgi:hypothetical protein
MPDLEAIPTVTTNIADAMLGLDRLTRLHALSIAASHRREAFILHGKTDDPDAQYDGEIARQVLVDAQLYADWLAGGTTTEEE